uniref:Cytotoxic and regulatory T cell molecule n=1 Tax=Crocodylus porosus TaxID=8502 RepID=A0A7M4E3G4_CROPO
FQFTTMEQLLNRIALIFRGAECIQEGKDLKLLCSVPGDSKSHLQWSNPQGFIIFLNTHRGLRDKRFKLIHYSKDELLVSLSEVRVQDEGVYTCFHYGTPIRTKTVNVMVLAAPAKPQLEVSDIIADGKERNIVLTCSTQGSKPPPRITWLLDNGIEVSGDTKHRFEHDGKKCNTTSTLTVHAYGKNSIASCVVRHETFGEEKQMASFQFEHLSKNLSYFSSFRQDLPIGNIRHWVRALLRIKSKDIGNRNKKLLLPILVSFLILGLLIIVLLFMRKLKKAHGVWKRENDASEQTLESYKSRSNEDNPVPEKNGQAFNHKSCMQYVTNGYAETIKKQPRVEDVSVFATQLASGRETDV